MTVNDSRHPTPRAQPTRRVLSMLAALAALVLALAPSDADAQELKPLVLVMIDTSNSMEYNLGPGDVLPTCHSEATCGNDGATPDATHTKSRMTVAIEALTGQFDSTEYRCCALSRSSQEPDPILDDHYAVPKQVTQVDNGIMDTYREEVRFGLMTFDNHPDPNSGNSGFFSYGGGVQTFNSGALDANANRGHHGHGQVIEKATGALQVIPPSDDPALITAGNDALQEEIRWLFPRGSYSPVAPIIDDAHYYITQDSVLTSEDCYEQRPKGNILVTDGEVWFDECYTDGVAAVDYDGDGDFNDCDDYYHVDGGQGADGVYDHPENYYRTAEYQAQRLLNDTGFPTYVIGFNASASADAKLRAIAAAGGTCDKVPNCYYVADDEQQLRFAFQQVIENLTAETNVISRTHPVTTQRTSFRANETGYYEVTAKFERQAGTWDGHLERVTFQCSNGQMGIVAVEDFADTIEAQASRTLYTSVADTAVGATLPSLGDRCGDVPLCDNDLVNSLLTPHLADIYNSNPTIALGPELDLPMGGYKAFRREWGGRDTLIFAGTNDGLLHAITLADVDGSGDTEGEERWAYIPRGVHDKLAQAQQEHTLTVDGTPIIEDVRLYRTFDNNTVDEKWATVLIGTLRSGGRGVFALDITDPDTPRFLWEHLATDADLNGDFPYERLGYTYAQPAVGSIVVEDQNGDRSERAVAVLPAGQSSGDVVDEGKALYVIDLATGDLLRSFTTLSDGSPLVEMTGSATGHMTVPGTLMNRVFMGDAAGRLLRLDMADPSPSNWTLDVFLDPVGEGLLSAATPNPEAAMAAPAVSRDREGNVVVHYGTGDVSSINPVSDRTNYVASVTEKIGFDGNGDIQVTSELNWLVELENGAKLTGSPVVFNKVAYFPTLENTPGQAACGGDAGRLWATHFTDTENGALQSVVDLDGDGNDDLHTTFAAGTIVFGLEIAVRPSCFDRTNDNGTFALSNPQPSTPQLVLQTGNPAYDTDNPPTTSDTPMDSQEVVPKVRVDLPKPATTLRTLGWGAVYN